MIPATADQISIGWSERSLPLPPVAVVAMTRPVALALFRRALQYSDHELVAWGGVAAPSGMVVLLALQSDSPALPWVDGVRYLGRDPAAPAAMLLPTNLQPVVPAALLYRALHLRFPGLENPFAVWPAEDGGLTIFPLQEARALDRAVMEAWR